MQKKTCVNNTLINAMTEQSVSTNDLAQQIGVPASLISAFRHGWRLPSRAQADNVEAVLNSTHLFPKVTEGVGYNKRSKVVNTLTSSERNLFEDLIDLYTRVSNALMVHKKSHDDPWGPVQKIINEINDEHDVSQHI